MPVYRQNLLFEIARGMKGFLRLEVGITRGGVSNLRPAAPLHAAEKVLRQPSKKTGRIARLRREFGDGKVGPGGAINPENIVWIFGTARTGSTWLAKMMGGLENHTVWDEPLVGALFGNFHFVRAAHKTGRTSLFADGRIRSDLIRSFILSAAEAIFPGATERGYLVIKEPNGSIGAPLMTEALPESRVIFLVRDPRDVVSSNLSGHAEGGWFRAKLEKGTRKHAHPPKDLDQLVRYKARKYREFVGKSKQAYDDHKGPKILVRYEDLRADTLGMMRRIYSSLDVPVNGRTLEKIVNKHSWETIPKEEKGEGKFYRKATPGAWREDLTPKQIRVVEKITAPLFREFYP
jgi:hypothetical protein